MNDIHFTMLWQDKNAKQITEFFKEKGIAAYYKGTGYEGTGLELPMQEPTIFVDMNKIEEAMAAYEEWKNDTPDGEGMTREEIETTDYFKQTAWMTKIYLMVFWIFFGTGILLLLYAFSQ